ncbi:MAG: glycosyltransferase [Actinomycetota bacterium]
MTPPLVSVVIPVHNAADTLVEQLDAIARSQTRAPSSEILVIDNRSTDDSADVARRWAEATGADLRIVAADERAGEPHARNVGLAAASGDFVAYCDADDRVGPDWLRSLCALLEHHAYATGPIDTTTMNPAWIANVRGTSVTGRSIMGDDVPYAHGCNMGFRRDALVAVGGFDERYTAGCDLDIALRMWEAGHDLGYGDGASIEYRLRPSISATFRQGVFYGRYRVHILDRLAAHGQTVADRRRRRMLWLVRSVPAALATRRTRARWAWVAGQLRGERLGRRDPRLEPRPVPSPVSRGVR